jgi:hypothetical protein
MIPMDRGVPPVDEAKNGPFGLFCFLIFPDEYNQYSGKLPSTPPRRAWVRRGKSLTHKVKVMAWTSPVFEEVVLCCEINSYVSAQL